MGATTAPTILFFPQHAHIVAPKYCAYGVHQDHYNQELSTTPPKKKHKPDHTQHTPLSDTNHEQQTHKTQRKQT